MVVNPQSSYTGAITLTLYDVPADVGGPIVPDGPAVPVALDAPGQNARLGFDGLAGDRFVVKVGSGFPAVLTLDRRADGNRGARTLVSSTGGLLDLRTLVASGHHELLVDPQGAATGSLALNLYAVPPDPLLAVVATVPRHGDDAAPGQNARLTFEGVAGRLFSLHSRTSPWRTPTCRCSRPTARCS